MKYIEEINNKILFLIKKKKYYYASEGVKILLEIYENIFLENKEIHELKCVLGILLYFDKNYQEAFKVLEEEKEKFLNDDNWIYDYAICALILCKMQLNKMDESSGLFKIFMNKVRKKDHKEYLRIRNAIKPKNTA